MSNFTRWFKEKFKEDFFFIENDYYGGQFSDYISETYEYQQELVEKLKKQNEELVRRIAETTSYIPKIGETPLSKLKVQLADANKIILEVDGNSKWWRAVHEYQQKYGD